VSLVAVNAEQASGRHFIERHERHERHERMRGRLTARLLAGAQVQDGANILDIGCGCGDVTILAARAAPGGGRGGARPASSPNGVVMPGAAWLVTAHAE
jgi:predicted O-methyltransferase YrrM